MVNTIFKRKNKRNILSHKEPGFSGIDFALYFVVIMIAVVLFSILRFRASMYLVEDKLENGLHIAEKSAVTSNYVNVGADAELGRIKIITECEDFTTSLSNVTDTEERAQIINVANDLVTYLSEQYNLVNNTTPQNNILATLCGSDSKIHIDKLTIYEPQYTTTVEESSEDGEIVNPYDDEEIPGGVSGNPFASTYEATTYAVYNVNFSDTNTVQGAISKTINSSPTLLNGDSVEGATIEVTLSIKLYGVPDIFTAVDPSANYETLSNTPLFKNTPTQTTYQISVVQSVDIVPATQDSRKK